MLVNPIKMVFLSLSMTVPTMFFYENYAKIHNVLGLPTPKQEIVKEKVIIPTEKIVVTKQMIEDKKDLIRKENKEKYKSKDKIITIIKKDLPKKEKQKVNTGGKPVELQSFSDKDSSINTLEPFLQEDFSDAEIKEVQLVIAEMMEMDMALNVNKEELDICFKDLDTKMCEKLITRVIKDNYNKE